MNSFDDMDIEDMLNNPLKNVHMSASDTPPPSTKKNAPEKKDVKSWTIPQQTSLSQEDFQRMDKNQPIDSRVLALEKNVINEDNKLETLKLIIEQQNERIGKLEEELDLLRKHLGNEHFTIEEQNDDESVDI